jgi:hypothetical protein
MSRKYSSSDTPLKSAYITSDTVSFPQNAVMGAGEGRTAVSGLVISE